MRRERCLFARAAVDHLSGSRGCGMSSASGLLSWPDLRSTPDRRSPVSCFSASDRLSVPDRRSFEARLSSPDRFSSLPIVVSVGLPRIMLDRANYDTQCARDLRQSLRASCCTAPKTRDSRGGAARNWIALILNRSAAGTKGAAELFTEWQCTGDWSLRCGAWLFWQRLRCW